MTMTTFRIDGAIVLWSLAEHSYLQPIKDGLEQIGYSKLVPKPRTYAAALKDALGEVCGGPRTLIRPLKPDDSGIEGFTVMDEHRGEDNNEYRESLVAKVTPGMKIKFRPFDDRAQTIVDNFNKQIGLVRVGTVTASLVSVLYSLGGTSPGRAVYWLPESKLAQWGEVRSVIEHAGQSGKNAVYIIRHNMDADAAIAIRDAIVAEVQTAAANISREIQEDELGDRALESRKQLAMDLRKKIQQYEEILAMGLGHLTQAVAETEQAIAAACLIQPQVA
jgi:hypothetical protein